MIKTGIVLCIKTKKAGIMTSSGEFIYIKTSSVLPKIGEIYTGELCKKYVFPYKYTITAALLMLVLISSVSAYAYYTPVTTIVLNINPSISLKANTWNKIISSRALNSDGNLILKNIKLKNKSIDTGLELIFKEAKIENFINDKYVTDKKIISVDIKSNKKNSIDISNFKKMIVSNNLKYIINASSSNNKKINITVDNKKNETSSLNSKNKNTNIKIHSPKKPLVDMNINKIQNKSSIIKVELRNNDKSSKSEDNKFNKYDKFKSEKMNNERDNSSIRKYINNERGNSSNIKKYINNKKDDSSDKRYNINNNKRDDSSDMKKYIKDYRN